MGIEKTKKKQKRIGVVILTIILSISMMETGLYTSYAAEQEVKYTYDSLGRVHTVTYPGKMMITYQYDKNGNIISETKEMLSTPETTQETGGNEASTEQNTTVGGTSTEQNSDISDKKDDTKLTVKDIKAYNKFKKRKPIVKSLKQSKKKSKRYLKIQIRKMSNMTGYPEMGYQIKYSTNKKFNKAKSITVKRKVKKSVTSKQWKVKKKKTYYVKVRAYMITKKGKKIYSKYSKVKKIKIK